MPGTDEHRAEWSALAVAVLAVATVCVGAALAGDAGSRDTVRPERLSALIANGKTSVEDVTFKDRPLAIHVVRGLPQTSPPVRAQETEIVSFGPGDSDRVKVVRGPAVPPLKLASRSETVTFADPLLAPVTVVRGPAAVLPLSSTDLFGPANGGELDRIAFAVDGIESRHGTDLRMWRPGPYGPQGPMQVSAAAALDVGGGDRFDLRQNRLLGRAYLAQMFQRYGNWRDALAAYNWGPGNLDQWIARGRDPNRLAPGVAYYIARVLRDALVTTAGL